MFLSHIIFSWNVWRMCYGPGAVTSPGVLAQRGGRGMTKLALIAGGSALVYASREPRVDDGRVAGDRTVKSSGRPGREAADGARVRRARGVRCEWV
jgi:hypothetical protein